MPAPRSVLSVLLRALGDFSLHPQGRPCGRPPAALRPGDDTTVTGAPASPSRQVIDFRQVHPTSSSPPSSRLGAIAMILWINGTFGAGKTSIAKELVEILPRARIYDPEQVGYMLRHILTEPIDDFQDWPPWRQLVVETAAQVHRYVGGVLVTPMTLLRRDYLREIFDGLASHGLEVRHVLVHAHPDELARRINHNQGLPEQTRRWRLDHLPIYQQALPWLTTGADLIDTTDRPPAQAARDIADPM